MGAGGAGGLGERVVCSISHTVTGRLGGAWGDGGGGLRGVA